MAGASRLQQYWEKCVKIGKGRNYTRSACSVSLISIIVGLGVMMYLAYKGMSLLLIGPIVSVIVLLASGMPVMETLTGAYSTSVSNFVKSNFLMILTASIFGSILGEAGAAQDIALCADQPD